MGKGTPRHYKVKRNNRAYWEPTAVMKRAGFQSIPLGVDGPQAFALAEEWNRRWDDTRRGVLPSTGRSQSENLSPEEAEGLSVYPKGTLGAAFKTYRTTDEWADKKPATRYEWHRAWRRIKPVFGDVAPASISLVTVSAFRKHIETSVSLNESHRTIKIWRALWKVAAALGYCERDADPSLGVRNKAPKGRDQRWSEGEVARLAKKAWRMGYHGLAVVIGVVWDSQMNPGDVRPLSAQQLATNGSGSLFFTERGKTGVPVGGILSRRTARLLAAYIESLGVELLGDAPIFRNRSGAPYQKDTLGDDFRTVRKAVFGEHEKRMLGHDMRRSGAVEAIAGEATPAALAHAMGNTLSASNALFATYVPVNAATIRQVAEARRLGRTRMR